MSSVLMSILITISLTCLIFSFINVVDGIVKLKKERENNKITTILNNCVESFKEFPDKIKEHPIVKDIFKLLVSANESGDFEPNLVFVHEFNNLTNSDGFRLFMEQNYVDGYFSFDLLDKLKSRLDSFFCYRESHLYDTTI